MDILKDFLRPEVVWTIVGLTLLLMEFVVPGLIIFFFGVGAFVVAGVCAFVDIRIDVQLIIFIVASVALLAILRKWLKGIFKGYSSDKNDMVHDIEEFIGQTAVVIKDIAPGSTGKVEFRGTNWSAQSDSALEKSTNVEIVGRSGLTLKVKSLS